jgi:hypothetical protein
MFQAKMNIATENNTNDVVLECTHNPTAHNDQDRLLEKLLDDACGVGGLVGTLQVERELVFYDNYPSGVWRTRIKA